MNRDNSKETFAAISCHGHLKSFSVQLDGSNNNQECLDGISPSLKNLNSLKLYGQISKLPVWIRDLKNLTKLKLQMPMLSQEAINFLRDLSKLKILRLSSREFEDGELQFVPSFNCLRLLDIACTSRLQGVKFHPSASPALEILRIRCYDVSSLQFSGLEHVDGLGILLSGSYDATFTQHLKSQLAKNPKRKPFLKLVADSS